MYAGLIKEPERDLVIQLTQGAAIFHGYEYLCRIQQKFLMPH